MSENEFNVKEFRVALLNYLINYLMKEKKERRELKRYNLTTRVSPEIYRQFDMFCRRLGLSKNNRTNIALEGLMAFFVEQYREHPTIIQQTLTQLFVKAEPKSHVEIDLSKRLELKLVKKDLTFILQRLETKKGDSTFLVDRLKDIVPKAIRIYEKTSDQEMEKLLTKIEKWV